MLLYSMACAIKFYFVKYACLVQTHIIDIML